MGAESGSQSRLRKIAGQIRERDSMLASLSAAQKYQTMMLPREVPEVPGYEFAWVYYPAEHVSGDFYDLIDLGGGRIGVLMGDVSGHGMEAGMIMGMAKKAIQIYARSGGGPVDTLVKGNDDLGKDLHSDTFLTVVYGVLDTEANRLEFVRAGHTHPVLLGPGKGTWEVVKSGGMMIGMTGGSIFAKSLQPLKLDLKPGQAFLLYTDGIIEAHERGGAVFGVDRMLECLEPAGDVKPLKEVLKGLVDEVTAWTAGQPQEDDITVLALRRNI